MQHDTTTITEQTIAAALERLAAEHQRSADRAEKGEERVFFRRWAGAFRKALYQYQQGVRPEPTPSGAMLVPSATRAGQVHQVGRDGKCSCEVRDRGCWHAALAAGVEVGMDDLDQFDGGESDSPPPPPNPIPHAAEAAVWLAGRQQFARRLAETARTLDGMRRAQQLGRAAVRGPLALSGGSVMQLAIEDNRIVAQRGARSIALASATDYDRYRALLLWGIRETVAAAVAKGLITVRVKGQ